MSTNKVRPPGPPAPPPLRALPAMVLGMLFRSVGVVAVLAVPVLTGVGSVDSSTPGPRADSDQHSVWKASYSERYPGCVPSALWPAEERPVAVLTRTQDGRVDRVLVDDRRRPLQPLPQGARTIGACR